MNKLTVTFRSPEHRDRFKKIVEETGKVSRGGKIDAYYGSALYLLTSDITIWQKVESYVQPFLLDFTEMTDNVPLSDEGTILVLAAWNLFNNQCHIDPTRFAELDDDNLALLVPAILLRQGETVLDNW